MLCFLLKGVGFQNLGRCRIKVEALLFLELRVQGLVLDVWGPGRLKGLGIRVLRLQTSRS